MNKRRFLFHVLFWVVQFSLNLYTELYLSPSFSSQPTLILFFQCALAVSIPLFITMGTTYYFLYFLIPKWIRNYGQLTIYAEAIGAIMTAAFCIRIAMQHLVWKIIYNEEGPELTHLQWLARYFYSLLNLLQVVGIAAAVKLFKLRISAVKNEKILVQEKLRSEIMHLKAQLNPHFLFNAINSIYSLARNNSTNTPDALIRLSKILRYVLYETEQKTISLKEDLQVINDYIELQQLRFGARLKTVFEKKVDNLNVSIAPMLLLPLVENAYKHGSEEGGLISIDVVLNQYQLTFTIKNPVAETLNKGIGETGIGLTNIKRQLELMYQDFSLIRTEDERTFCVTLKINLKSYVGFKLFNHRG